MFLLSFVQRTFDGVGEMVLAAKESVGTGEQLLNNACKKALISRQTLGYFSTLDLIQVFA